MIRIKNVKSVYKIKEAVRYFEREAKTQIDLLQKQCKHPRELIVEGEFIPSGAYCHASPPFRVCTACGYAEEGWHCGYWKLDGNCNCVDREEAMKYVVTFIGNEKLADMRFGK